MSSAGTGTEQHDKQHAGFIPSPRPNSVGGEGDFPDAEWISGSDCSEETFDITWLVRFHKLEQAVGGQGVRREGEPY